LGEPPAAAGFVEFAAPPGEQAAQAGWMVELTFPNGVSLRLRG
jgi:hypothetical protein